MGVKGLLSHCLEQRSQCVKEFDLIEVARDRGGIEILVDFYSFQQFIVQKFWQGLSQVRQNEYLRIIGAEYGTLDEFITKLVKDLESLGIWLVFYVDGARGSSPRGTQEKMNTWIHRFDQDIDRIKDLMDVCRGMRSMQDLPKESSVRPVLLEPQVMQTLRRCGCEVHQCVAGEADLVIAKSLVSRLKAFAVLSNDSDFCIFRGSCFIPQQLFDLNNDLCLGGPGMFSEKPVRLRVGVIAESRLISMMGFQDHSGLVELSIVGGNDFTGKFMHTRGGAELLYKLDIEGRRNMAGIAGWVRHYQKVENNKLIAEHMKRDPNFRNAVNYSRQFYNLNQPADIPVHKGQVTNLLSQGVEQGIFPANLIAMHNNVYWHRVLLEDPAGPCVEITLAELRSFIYRMVLPYREDRVTEYGGSSRGQFITAPVYAAGRNLNIPSVTYIKQNKVFQNLRFFHQILTYLEPDREMNYFDRYGRKNGFVCHILRYFLLLNWGRNLFISETEFLALVALVMGRPSDQQYQGLSLQPTPRCVTIANWFQDVYRHAYLFLGHLLHLTNEFPEPREVFCGSAWIAFHTCADDEAWHRGCRLLRRQELNKVQSELNRITKEKRHVIRHLVEDIFPFEDRW